MVASSPLERLEFSDPEGRQVSEPLYRAALAGQAGCRDMVAGGRVFALDAVPVRDADGKVLYAMVMAQDVTGRREQEQRLRDSLREKEVLLKAIHGLDGTKTLGLQLVQMLAAQLGGTVAASSESNTRFEIEFAARE